MYNKVEMQHGPSHIHVERKNTRAETYNGEEDVRLSWSAVELLRLLEGIMPSPEVDDWEREAPDTVKDEDYIRRQLTQNQTHYTITHIIAGMLGI